MKSIFSSCLVVLMVMLAVSAVSADQSKVETDWRAALKNVEKHGGLESVLASALLAGAPASEVVETAIKSGNDPYQVVRIGINPGVCPGGCACGVIRGAVTAGASPAIISKAAIDAGVDNAVVNRGLAAGNVSGDVWRAGLQQALEQGNLGQAMANPILACVPPADVVKAAVSIGHKPYLVVRAAIHSAGAGCLSEVLDGATEAGVPCAVIARAAFDACICPPEQAGLGYTPAEYEPPPPPPPPPPPDVSPHAPK